jgi:hypothetical protein
MNKTRNEKRSPLKVKPLRNPGESLQEEMERLLDDELMPYAGAALFALGMAAYEWMAWFSHTPRQPVLMTVIAAIAIAYAARKFVTVRKRYRALRLGWEGEKAVGQYLELLRSQGCQVFHDVVGDKFNIDHVVVSPRGIFVIETKTYSKPVQGQATAEFDGERLLINGFEPERNAISQVRALGGWLRDLLAESTNRRFPVRCVVVLPGWFVEARNKQRGDVWVLNPKALPAFIANEPIVLKEEDVALVASRLIIHIRTAG